MSAPAALTREEGVARLASIMGSEHVSVRDGVGEVIVVTPADVGQIAEVMRFANANGLAVMPTGGRTKLRWGYAVAPEIELSLARFRGLREHAWQDMTCIVQAGCSWAMMQGELKLHGQMVALDPLWPERADVGGIVACNDSGALRLKYGGLRDLIIGMTVVLADGTVARSGGKVVKNVAGYDMHKLMTGSFGTLGVIVEVNFRLHPVEEHARTWTASLPDGAASTALDEPMRALMDSGMVPSGVQLRVSQHESAIDVRVAGLAECLDEYGARVQSIFGKLAIRDAAQDVWTARQGLFEKEDALVLKVSVLPSEICTVSEELRRWCAGESADAEAVAQATGLMTVAIVAAPETLLILLDRLRAQVSGSGGSVVALQAPSQVREKIDVWGPDRGTLPLMREIKRRFDPHRILNPGRFVGAI
jgi:glycolate oxidase FAD binding subunit